MQNKLVYLAVAVLAACVVFSGAFLISSAASWSSCTGGSDLQCIATTNTSTTPVTKWIRWGVQLANETTTSGLGFQVSEPNVVDAISTTPFLLGKLTHDNVEVGGRNNLASSVILNINMSFNVNGSTYLFPFQTQISINETLNQPTPLQNGYCIYQNDWQTDYGVTYTSADPCCPYPSNPNLPCSDKIQSTVLNAQELVIGNVKYQVVIFGFANSPDPTNATFQPTANFVSQEQTANSAYLFARLIVSCLSGSNEACAAGLSTIQAQCSSGVCSNGECVYSAINQGSTCTNPNSCITSPTCQAGSDGTGICTGNPAATGSNCQLSDGSTPGVCIQPVCEGGVCTPEPKKDGVTGGCSNISTNNPCTQNQCQSGNCVPVSLDGTTCSNPANPLNNNQDPNCNKLQCSNSECQYVPNNVGSSCGNGASDPCNPYYCDNSGDCSVDQSRANYNVNACTGPSYTPPCQYVQCYQGACTLYNYNSQQGSCSGSVNECVAKICSGGTCGTTSQNNYQSCGSTPNNCSATYCYNGVCNTYNQSTSYVCGNDINNCTHRRCNGGGSCVNTYVPNNNGGGSCTGNNGANDCQYLACNGNGGCTVFDYNNGQSCSSVASGACHSSTCSTGTCNSNVDQSQTGKCTHINCQTASCNSTGSCVYSNNANGSSCSNSSSDPCNPIRCNGLGSCVPRPDLANNATSCTNKSPGEITPVAPCQALRCDGLGGCRTNNFTYATPACAPDNNTADCKTFQCQTGQCDWLPAVGAVCTDNNPCTDDSCNDSGTCISTPDDSNSCTGQGQLPPCQVWECKTGTCTGTNSHLGICTDNNICTTDQCTDSGTCSHTDLDGSQTCTESPGFIIPECQKAGCVEGNCGAVPDRSVDGVPCEVNATRDCYAKECNNGTCTAVSVVGNPCQTAICHQGVCEGPDDCLVTNMNEGQVCESDAANHCADKICESGDCTFDPNFWDGHFCELKSLCQSYQCSTGVCNTSFIVQLSAGTHCLESTFSCSQWTCDPLGNCLQSVGDGAYCFSPDETFKRQGGYYYSSEELPECHAFQCDGGACTSTVVPMTGTACERNYTSPCLEALCNDGVCSPVQIDGCDDCANFQDCNSCLTGTFRRDETSSSAAPSTSTNGCVWCRNLCIAQEIFIELTNLTDISLICSGDLNTCPLPSSSGNGGSDHTVAIIAGTLSGAAALAALAAAAAAIAFILKRRADLAKKNITVGGFDASNNINESPIHDAPQGAMNSPIYG